MKIALIAPERLPVPPALGGAIEQTLYDTALAIRDPELCVISAWHPALQAMPAFDATIFQHVDVPRERRRVQDALGNRLPLDVADAQRFYYLNGVTEHLCEIDPDVIQVHNRPDFIPYFRRQFPGKYLILFVHNAPDACNPGLIQAVSDSDHLIFVSRFLRDWFCAQMPLCAGKSTVIYNGIDTTRWHPGLKTAPETQALRKQYGLRPGRTAIFVGRTTYKKGIGFLLDAMRMVKRELPDARLLIVGSPFFGLRKSDPFLTRLKDQAHDLGESAIFTGYIDQVRLPHYYAAADVAVMPSLYREAFGKVAAEAMAIGLPVIASRRGALPELVDHGKTGILIDDPCDVTALAEQVVMLMTCDVFCKNMGKAAREKAQQVFSSHGRIQSLRIFYHQYITRPLPYWPGHPLRQRQP